MSEPKSYWNIHNLDHFQSNWILFYTGFNIGH
ncbi:hypothetical protein Avbf_04816, partial [Armadillidium vulgare]